ncbi:MAG: hypothetical protein AAFY28_05960 [Actinomycetota bacterium]
MTDIDVPPTDNDDATDESSNRRALLAKLAVGGAGAAVGAVALGRTASAGSSGGMAIGGNALELGDPPNTSTENTYYEYKGGPIEDGDGKGASAFSACFDRPDDAQGNNVAPAAIGGYGKGNDIPNGVHGSVIQNADGFGVVAANLTANPETSTMEAPRALALISTGSHIWFDPTPSLGPETPGNHGPGELVYDRDGTLWLTVPQSEAPGYKYLRIAGAPTAGAVTFLEKAERCADTRESIPVGRPGRNSTIEVDLTKNTAEAPTGVVSDATAAIITMTVANTVDRGFFRASAPGATFEGQGSSNGNWVGDDLSVAATIFTRLVDGKIDATIGGAGTADIIIDVTAFYR